MVHAENDMGTPVHKFNKEESKHTYDDSGDGDDDDDRGGWIMMMITEG